MTPVAIGLGSNLGDRQQHILRARQCIEDIEGFCFRACSSVYETQPLDMPADTPWFLNAVLVGEYAYDARRLLHELHRIEQSLGRVRDPHQRYSSRSCDLDILLFGQELISSEGISVPHPRLHKRRFVLEPLCEIVEAWVHPRLQKDVHQLLRKLR